MINAWVINETRDESSTVYGWPHAVVERMAKNRVSTGGGANREFFYPLLNKDFKGPLAQQVTPQILKFLKQHGVIIAGWPGRGKTQYAKMLAMLMGTYWVDSQGLTGKRPCWRRGKKLERFNRMAQD